MDRACLKCGKNIDIEDIYCRYCGAPQSKKEKFAYTIPGIILATLAVGPFSLYYVWKAKLLKRNTQITLTALIILFTLFSIWLIFVLLKFVYYDIYQKIGVM